MYIGLRQISTVSFGGEAAFRRKNWATAVLDGGRRRVRSGGAGEVVRRATTATGVGRYLRAATVLPVDRWRTWYPGGHTPPPPQFLPLPLFCCKDSGSSCNRPGGLTRRLGFPRIAAPCRPQIQRDGRSGHPRARGWGRPRSCTRSLGHQCLLPNTLLFGFLFSSLKVPKEWYHYQPQFLLSVFSLVFLFF
jgi:hypothetical protein